jgi:hypothetical protein
VLQGLLDGLRPEDEAVLRDLLAGIDKSRRRKS